MKSDVEEGENQSEGVLLFFDHKEEAEEKDAKRQRSVERHTPKIKLFLERNTHF